MPLYKYTGPAGKHSIRAGPIVRTLGVGEVVELPGIVGLEDRFAPAPEEAPAPADPGPGVAGLVEEMNVDQVLVSVRDGRLDLDQALAAERQGKQRRTLLAQLEALQAGQDGPRGDA